MNGIGSQTEFPPNGPGQPLQSSDLRPERHRRRAGRLIGLVAVSGLAVLVGLGAHTHAQREVSADGTLAAQRDTVPLVRTMVLRAVDTPREIELPGSTQAFDTATLYARATGYIAKRNVDIGSRVRAGTVLAVIAAPDLDQQLAQTRAQLVQLRANVLQAQATVKVAYDNAWRTAQTAKDGWTSQQQADVDRDTLLADAAALAVARANVMAQQAQVNRLVQLTGFEQVVAPFDGVITSRQIDVGSLVAANDNSGTPLFSIAHTDTLRVQIYMPQDDYFGIKDGDKAEVTVPELPGRIFHGRLARNANALQSGTRTVLAEVDVDNKDGALVPGVYTLVHLREPRQYPVIVVPSQAVILGVGGPQVAVYSNGVLHLRQLDIAADNGATIEARRGLHAGDRLILNPPIGATDGVRVTTPSEPVS